MLVPESVVYDLLVAVARSESLMDEPVNYSALTNVGRGFMDRCSDTHGYVYGICALLTDEQRDRLVEEAEARGIIPHSNSLPIDGYSSGQALLYPLYWGKCQYHNQGLQEHMNNDGNSSLFLPGYSILDQAKLYYGTVCTSNMAALEKHMQRLYPHMLKTSSYR